MGEPQPPDEFDWLILEPDPDILYFPTEPDFVRNYLTPIRDAARAEKARLRAAKRAAEAAAAERAAAERAGTAWAVPS